MTDESIIYPILQDSAALQALVNGRVYRVRGPRDVVAPYVVYDLVSSLPANYFDGPPGIDSRRVQVTAYARSPAEAKQVFAAIREALQSEHYLLGELPDEYDEALDLYLSGGDWSIWSHR